MITIDTICVFLTSVDLGDSFNCAGSKLKNRLSWNIKHTWLSPTLTPTGFCLTLFILLIKVWFSLSQAYVPLLTSFPKIPVNDSRIEPDYNTIAGWIRSVKAKKTSPSHKSLNRITIYTSVCIWGNVVWHAVRPIIPNHSSVRKLPQCFFASSKPIQF